jgi:putative FmdB family regulatory protein
MPLYQYEPFKTPCKLCGKGFESAQKAVDPELSECPKCGQAVRRSSPQAINTPFYSKPLSISDAKASGFTVLKKTSKGEYEKQ